MNAAAKMFFDEQFYLLHEDLRQAKLRDASFDLFEHFINYGIREGRSPSFLFDLHFVRSKLARYNATRVDLPDVISAFLDIPPAERFVPNSWFSPWSFRRMYGPLHEEVESLADYELFEYYMAHVHERALSPSGLFSEEAYRAQYPDLADAVQRGMWRSGFLHFLCHGAAEGRRNLPGFDLNLYRATGGFETEKDYVLAHHADLRRVVPWFDESFYLSVYDDAHELKRREMIRSGLEHFLVLGFSEGRIPHPAMLDDMARPWSGSAWTFLAALERVPPSHIELDEASRLLRHLSDRGLRKDRRQLANAIWRFVAPPAISGTFDESFYLAVNPDVARSLAGSPPGSAASHWREHGLKEQRVAPNSNVFANRRPLRQDVLQAHSGVNFFGPLSATSGLGSAARGYVAALRSAGVPVDTYDVSWLISRDLPLDLFSANDLAYSINFVYLNPDQILPFVDRFGTAVFDHRANVAFWVWELPSPRPEWRAVLSGFDLILTPSDFCTQGVATFTDRPVVTCPHVVDQAFLMAELQNFTANPWVSRLEAEKAAGKRVVLFIMDASSYVARKGIDVFLAMAARFEEENPGRCAFVLKTHSKDCSNHTYRVSHRSVIVINEVLKLPDLIKLKSLADVYVSPHRSEGFGLNIFESIILGVPVLCSMYGGGVDGLPEDYPFRIPGRLTEIGRDMGPYRRDAIWFEPSADAACEMLGQMLGAGRKNRRFGQIVTTVRSRLSIEAIGARLRRILEEHGALAGKQAAKKLKRSAPLASPQLDESFQLGLPARLDESARLNWLREAAAAAISPMFTIVTPTYNTPPEFLNELYEDLVAQTFPGWEWCLCDDGSAKPETAAALRELRRKDARVRVKFLPKNTGISAATNMAVTLASGRYLVMVDHDDRVHAELLHTYRQHIEQDEATGIFYCDEDKLAPDGRSCDAFFKPDWSPEHIMSAMYVLHCLCIRKSDFLSLGGYRSEYDGAQDHDFVLRAAAAGASIRHVDRLLYHWRKTAGSAAASSSGKEYAIEAGRRAVADYMAAGLNLQGSVEYGLFAGTYRVRPEISPGRVSLIVLTACTQIQGQEQTYVERFVRSILAHGSSADFEIRVVVDEGRCEAAAPLAALDPRVRLVPFRRNSVNFSFAEKANFAVKTSDSDRVVLLNDDMEAADAGWLPALLELLELPGVGIVGGRLLHEDGSVQHAGIVLGIHGCCAHVFEHLDAAHIGYNGITHLIRNYSAVTGAMVAFRRSTFDLVGGFNHEFPIDYNDVDFCLRVIESGLRVVYTPFAELKHFESRSAKRLTPDSLDTQRFREKWAAYIARDPFYNSNLTRDGILFEERVPSGKGPVTAAQPEQFEPAAISFEQLAPMEKDLPKPDQLGRSNLSAGLATDRPSSLLPRSIEELAAQGFVMTSKPDLRLVVNGRVVLPFWMDGLSYHFELPDNTRDVRIVSRSFVPGEVWRDSPASKDARRLGICLGGMFLHVAGVAREIAIRNPALRTGFHGIETNGVQEWRWTDGDACFSLSLPGDSPSGGVFMELRLLWPGSYWMQRGQLGPEGDNLAAQPPWSSPAMARSPGHETVRAENKDVVATDRIHDLQNGTRGDRAAARRTSRKLVRRDAQRSADPAPVKAEMSADSI